jgi:hypothetical protein
MYARRAGSLVFPLLLAALSLVGCYQTKLTNLWMDPDIPASPMDNLLVVSLERDPALRRLWEDALAAEFQARGVHARPSHQLWSSLPDSQQVPLALRRDGNDGAVVTHRLPVTQSANVDSDYRKTTAATGSDYWRDWYFTHHQHALKSPASSKEKEARYQIDLVGAAGGLVWMGSTTAIDPRNAEKVRAEVAGQLVPELSHQRIIPGRK